MEQQDAKLIKQRQRKKKMKYGGIAFAITVIVTAIVVLVNVVVGLLVERYPNAKIDLTSSNLYEVSDETIDYIKNLTEPVEIAVSSEESTLEKDSYLKMVTELLKKYQGYSSEIEVTYFDTTKDPDILSKYQSKYSGTISSDNVIVCSGDRVKVFPLYDFFDMDQDKLQYYYYGQVSLSECITAFKGEQSLTNAIMNVTDANPQRVGFIGTSNGNTIYSPTQGNQYAAKVLSTLLDDNGYIASGSIRFDGMELTTLPLSDMYHIRGNAISVIFQEPMTSLNPVFSVERQLCEPFMIHQGMRKKEARRSALKMLYDVQIPNPETVMKQYPHQLSGGMRQRVMIAMALACRPKILIADEPTTALDVTIQAQILRLMNDLQRENGTSIIFITHDLGVINEMADDVVVMYCGQVVEQSSARVIFTDCAMSHPYTEGLMNSIPRIDNITHKLEPIPGVVPHPLALPKGCKFAPRCKYATRKCLEEEPPLVEVVPGQKIRCFYPEKEVRNSAEHKKALIDHQS